MRSRLDRTLRLLILANIVVVALLVYFPQLVLFIPNWALGAGR